MVSKETKREVLAIFSEPKNCTDVKVRNMLRSLAETDTVISETIKLILNCDNNHAHRSISEDIILEYKLTLQLIVKPCRYEAMMVDKSMRPPVVLMGDTGYSLSFNHDLFLMPDYFPKCHFDFFMERCMLAFVREIEKTYIVVEHEEMCCEICDKTVRSPSHDYRLLEGTLHFNCMIRWMYRKRMCMFCDKPLHFYP